MNENIKYPEEMVEADFEAHPVWEFVNDDDLGETALRPVKNLPVDDLGNRVIGVQVMLANGRRVWASLCNIHLEKPRSIEHLLTAAFYRNGKRCFLGRYFDPWRDDETPEALAAFLGMNVDDVFPISYDLRPHVKGDASVVTGTILKEPRERLSWDEISSLR